jgi:hypothetical protein
MHQIGHVGSRILNVRGDSPTGCPLDRLAARELDVDPRSLEKSVLERYRGDVV